MLFLRLFVSLVFVTWILLAAKEETISEKQIKLKRGTEVGVVQKKVFSKRFRFELSPLMVGATTNDLYFNHYLYGLGLSGHLNDQFGVEFLYFFASSSEKDMLRYMQNDYGQGYKIGKLKSSWSGNLLWTPFYGKLSFNSKTIIHFDTYLTSGLGNTKTSAENAFTFNIGMGEKIFLSHWFALRIDIRDYIYRAMGYQSSFKNDLTVTLGCSVFSPTIIR